jgi:hypothetical protein
LSGPDISQGGFPAVAPGDFDYLPLLGAYDFHDYDADFDFRTGGHIAAQERNAARWAKFAHDQGKPLFLSEFGTMGYGWQADKPGPTSPQSVLAGSELVLREANAGVDGFIRWSFLNRGDLDGQWQFVDTWDRKNKKLLTEFTPHPNSYFALGLLSRFTAKNSTVLASQVSSAQVKGWQRVFCAAFRSPKGNLTLAIVNDAPVEFALKLSWGGNPTGGEILPLSLHRGRTRPRGREGQSAARVFTDPGKSYLAGRASAEQPDHLQHLQTASRRSRNPGGRR